MKSDQSILDSVRDDVASLERDLGSRDRVRLTEYLDHVREIEQRIERAEKQANERHRHSRGAGRHSARRSKSTCI